MSNNEVEVECPKEPGRIPNEAKEVGYCHRCGKTLWAIWYAADALDPDGPSHWVAIDHSCIEFLQNKMSILELNLQRHREYVYRELMNMSGRVEKLEERTSKGWLVRLIKALEYKGLS